MEKHYYTFDNYLKTREYLSENIINLIDIGKSLNFDNEIEILKEFNTRLLENVFRIIVIGEFKRGKSTLINALIGKNILPVGITPTTATLNILRYGQEPYALIKYKDDTEKKESLENLSEYITTKGKETQNISNVTIFYPLKFCQNGVEIIDSPGVNDIDEELVEITYNHIPRCDTAIFLLNSTQQLSASEREFFSEKVSKYVHKIFFVLNKIDHLDKDEQNEVITYVNHELSNIIENPKLFPLSAKLALNSKKEQNKEGLKESKFDEFETELLNFLATEKGKIALKAPLYRCFSAIDKMKYTISAKLSSYEMSLTEIENKYNESKPEFEKLWKNKNILLQIIEDKKNTLKEQIITNLKIDIFNFKKQIEDFVLSTTTQDLDELQKETQKFLEKLMRKWGEKKEEFIEDEIEILMIQINQKVEDIQRVLDKIKKSFLSKTISYGNSILEEDGQLDNFFKKNNIFLSIIPGFLGGRIGGLFGAVRGIGLFIGSMMLMSGALIPALILSAGVSYLTERILKDNRIKKQKKEFADKINEKMDKLPEEIIPSVGKNLDEFFDNLKNQMDKELSSMISSVQTTLDLIIEERKNKELEIDKEKKSLNDKVYKIDKILENLKEVWQTLD